MHQINILHNKTGVVTDRVDEVYHAQRPMRERLWPDSGSGYR